MFGGPISYNKENRNIDPWGAPGKKCFSDFFIGMKILVSMFEGSIILKKI